MASRSAPRSPRKKIISAIWTRTGSALVNPAALLGRRRPVPFPPEPLRTGVIQLTRNRLAAAGRNEGRRGAWLTALDRLGLGFDS